MDGPTLCLTMIVKNEEPRMPRLLDSVKGIIREVVISDTGSTDKTIEVTRAWCEKEGMKCHVDETPFKDFGYNRTVAMRFAQNKSSCTFLLLLDADMKLRYTPEFVSKNVLATLLDQKYNNLLILQKSGSCEYYNSRIMLRTLKGIKSIGVTHEFNGADEPINGVNLDPRVIWIDDIGDGGSKANKFERDYNLLKQGLKDEPGNVRYMFYLGETCRNSGRHGEAIMYYEMRASAGGWAEEVFRSLYGASMSYYAMNDMEKGDLLALRAWLARPTRAESLYTACRINREKGNNERASSFYQLGHRIPPPSDVLFVETDCYKWGWDYEFSVYSFYLERPGGPFRNPIGMAACLRKILTSMGTMDRIAGGSIPEWIYRSMVDNMRFYVELLPTEFKRTDIPVPTMEDFTSSSPCVARLRGYPHLVRMVRMVDYKMTKPEGGYKMGATGLPQSRYMFSIDDCKTWKELDIEIPGDQSSFEFPITNVYHIEDLKIFNVAERKKITLLSSESTSTADPVYGIATYIAMLDDGWHHTMVLLRIDLEKAKGYPLKTIKKHNRCEKNHTPISGTDEVIYAWGPKMQVYNLQATTKSHMRIVNIVDEDKLPLWFKSLRGSTCAIPFPSTRSPACPEPIEYWSVGHTSIYTKPRSYLSTLVRLDAKTKRCIGFSLPFHFDDYEVEFCLGIALEDNDRTLVISYSVYDSTSREVRIPVDWILARCIVMKD